MILVDDRIGSVEIAPLLSSPTVVCSLSFADFVFSGNGPKGPVDIGVERKSLMDLLKSMTTGRLSGHQLVGLTNNYDWVYLLVEGVWRPDRHNGMLQRTSGRGKWVAVAQGSRRFMARDVYNFIQTLQVMCGVIAVRTSSTWETARWLDACRGWWGKEWKKHKSHLQFQKPVTHAQLTKPNLVVRMASQLEGIGWDKAKKIGEKFDNMGDLLNAPVSAFMEIDGIGGKLANSIVCQLEGRSTKI